MLMHGCGLPTQAHVAATLAAEVSDGQTTPTLCSQIRQAGM